jgi:hypothetical protein
VGTICPDPRTRPGTVPLRIDKAPGILWLLTDVAASLRPNVATTGLFRQRQRWQREDFPGSRIMQRRRLETAVIARLDRAIQYTKTAVIDRKAGAYWIVPEPVIGRRMRADPVRTMTAENVATSARRPASISLANRDLGNA